MTEKQVRARLAKRKANCYGPLTPCPGWRVVDLKSKPEARLRACEECNALAPVRLRVDDSMVAMLGEAETARRVRERALVVEAQVRATTTHYHDGLNIMCGAESGWSKNRRRRHAYTPLLRDVDCVKCLRLANQTPAERANEEFKKQQKLDELRGKKAEERAADRAARLGEVEVARQRALALLDALEEAGDHLRIPERLHYDLGEVLGIAVDAHVLVGGTAGKRRLWMMIDGGRVERNIRDVACRFCGEVLAHDRAMGKIAEHEFMEHTVECALRYLAKPLLPPERDVEEADLTEGQARDAMGEFAPSSDDMAECATCAEPIMRGTDGEWCHYDDRIARDEDHDPTPVVA